MRCPKPQNRWMKRPTYHACDSRVEGTTVCWVDPSSSRFRSTHAHGAQVLAEWLLVKLKRLLSSPTPFVSCVMKTPRCVAKWTRLPKKDNQPRTRDVTRREDTSGWCPSRGAHSATWCRRRFLRNVNIDDERKKVAIIHESRCVYVSVDTCGVIITDAVLSAVGIPVYTRARV